MSRKSRGWIGRLVDRSHGTAAVGYALVLAVMVVLVLVGAAMLGAGMQRALSRASAGIAAPCGHDQRESDILSEDYASEAIAEPVSASTRLLRLLVFCLVVAVVTVPAVIGWLMLRHPSKKPEDQEPQGKEPLEEKILWTRLNTKRELLWKQLLADHDLVMNNRIEVRHVMTRDPLVVGKATPGKQIAELFSKHQVTHLPVCDDDKHLLGVITAGDHRANPAGCAEDTMRPPQTSVSSNTTLGAAISVLMGQGVSFLPVLDREKLRGVLTSTDLAITLHCSLQLWFRVAQTMQTNAGRVEHLEATNRSIGDIAGNLEDRVRRLPEEVKAAIQTGDSSTLVAQLNETMMSVSRLMRQLEEAQKQIDQHTSQITDLKDPSPDAVTGAASRQELDRVLNRLLSGAAAPKQSLTLVLFVAEGYQRLRQEQGPEAADDHLRLAVRCVAENVEASDHVARYSNDTLAIVLPGTGSDDARKFCSRLSSTARSIMGDHPHWQPIMSIVVAHPGESAVELLGRAEAALESGSGERELVAAVGPAG